MRILFASRHPYIPQIAGGAQSSVHELAGSFAARGDRPGVLAGLTGDGWLGLRGRIALKLGRGATVTDGTLGYPVLRAWDAAAAADEAARRFRPDVAVVQSGHPVAVAQAFVACGVPTVVYLRNVEADDHGGNPAALSGAATFVANSHFTAAWYAERFGIKSRVVYPLVRPERYAAATGGDRVVFINPHPSKGLEVAVGLAKACPEIPFLFVEAWTLDAAARAALMEKIAPLRNVELAPRARDMRAVYGRARIVLAPSQWREAFGRVAAEAHVSGVPVIASDIGGLPEAVGPGGRLVAPDAGVEVWAAALRGLWYDRDAYADAAAGARRHAARPELDPARQLATLREIFAAAQTGA